MKYAQILLATTLTAAAATSFADSKTTDAKTTTAEEKVIVTTQELPESNAPVAGASAEQPAALKLLQKARPLQNLLHVK